MATAYQIWSGHPARGPYAWSDIRAYSSQSHIKQQSNNKYWGKVNIKR